MSDLGERLRRASGLVPGPEDPFERLTRRRDRKRRNERLLAGAVALVLVGGLLGGLLTVLGRTPHRGGPAATGPNVTLGDGQYLYRKATVTTTQGTMVTETWWATDGSGRVEFACSIPNCDQVYGAPQTGTFGPGNFPTDDDMTGLSADPATLLQQLEERTAPGGHSPEPAFSPGPELTPGVTVGGLWDAIANILEDPNGSPDLKAAAFEVASGLEGVQVQADATDPGGRPATELSLQPNATAYFFDPQTHLLMGSGYAPFVRPPAGNLGTTYDEGIVDSTDATPTGDQWLFPQAAPPPTP